MRKIVITLSFICFIITGNLIAQDDLPDVTVERLDGQRVSILDEVKNNDKKITIINFWATWCKPCRNELENIADLYPDWVKDYNVELIAVSIDDSRTKSQIKPYINSRGLEYKILIDANQDLFKAVNGTTPPLTLIINESGKIVKVEHGYIEGNEYELEDILSEMAN